MGRDWGWIEGEQECSRDKQSGGCRGHPRHRPRGPGLRRQQWHRTEGIGSKRLLGWSEIVGMHSAPPRDLSAVVRRRLCSISRPQKTHQQLLGFEQGPGRPDPGPLPGASPALVPGVHTSITSSAREAVGGVSAGDFSLTAHSLLAGDGCLCAACHQSTSSPRTRTTVAATFTSGADSCLQGGAKTPGTVPGDIRVAAHGSIPASLAPL